MPAPAARPSSTRAARHDGRGRQPHGRVDHELRVHGLFGLRAADASIMPTVVSGDTSVACIMIGEKCAEMMLGAR
jgi:choline dehydrogenase